MHHSPPKPCLFIAQQGKLVGGGENPDNVVVRIELNQAEANKIKRAICADAASGDCTDRITGERGKTFLSLFCDGNCINPEWQQYDSVTGGSTLKSRYRNEMCALVLQTNSTKTAYLAQAMMSVFCLSNKLLCCHRQS